MTWRRRLRRRLLWAGVLLGLVLLLVAVSVLRACAWGRDLVTENASRFGWRATTRKGGTMIRTLTFIVGTTVAVVAIAPSALGNGQPAPPSAAATGRLQFSAVTFGGTPVVPGSRPGHSGKYSAGSGQASYDVPDGNPPATYRASAPHRGTTATPPLAGIPTYTTRPSMDAPAKLAAARTEPRLFRGHTNPESAARATPGRGIDWSRIGVGIGIGIGMALAIGLALAVQTKPTRPLPH